MAEVVGVDEFARALEDIFSDVDKVSVKALEKGVKTGASTSAKEWRANAAASFNGNKYRKSIRYAVDRTGSKPKATVYSTMPGLPHLLEKDHATIGGGKVPGRVHIDPAAQSGFDAAMKAVEEGLGEL